MKKLLLLITLFIGTMAVMGAMFDGVWRQALDVQPEPQAQPAGEPQIYDSPPGAMYGSDGNGGTADTVDLEDWYRAHPDVWYFDEEMQRWRRR